MIVDVSQKLKNVKGEVVKDEKGTELSLKDLILTAVDNGHERGQVLSISDLSTRKRIAFSVQSADGKVEMKSEDVTLIKQLISRLPTNTGLYPTIAAIAIDMVEPQSAE